MFKSGHENADARINSASRQQQIEKERQGKGETQRCLKREICVQVRTRGKRGRGRGFCVASTQEEHRRGNRLRVVSIQERADCVRELPRRGGEIRVRKVLARKIPRRQDSLPRPTKGDSVPIQKEGTGPKSCQRRRTRPQSKRRDRSLQGDGVMVVL